MARPKSATTLYDSVIKGDYSDFSEYSQNTIIECIKALVDKVKEKKGSIISESQLRGIRTSLENQITKINAVIPKDDNAKEAV